MCFFFRIYSEGSSLDLADGKRATFFFLPKWGQMCLRGRMVDGGTQRYSDFSYYFFAARKKSVRFSSDWPMELLKVRGSIVVFLASQAELTAKRDLFLVETGALGSLAWFFWGEKKKRCWEKAERNLFLLFSAGGEGVKYLWTYFSLHILDVSFSGLKRVFVSLSGPLNRNFLKLLLLLNRPSLFF